MRDDVLEEIVTPIIASFIVIINSVVIYYIIKYRNAQHNPIAMVYMLNMAFGNFFVGFLMILLTAVDVIIHQYDNHNHSSYRSVRDPLIRLSLFISILNLIPLTIDRVWAVRYPISHRQSKRKFAVKICIGVWSVSILLVTIFYSIVYLSKEDNERLHQIIFPFATYPTTLIFIVCYAIIFRALRSSRKYRERTGSRSLSRSQFITNQPMNSGSTYNLSKFDEKKSEVRFLHMAVKTVVVFIVCWFPIATCGLPTICQCNKKTEITFLTLGYLNAALTPLIHYSHLRQALKKKLRRLTTSRRQPKHVLGCTLDNDINSSSSAGSGCTTQSDSNQSKNTSIIPTDSNDEIYTVTKSPQ